MMSRIVPFLRPTPSGPASLPSAQGVPRFCDTPPRRTHAAEVQGGSPLLQGGPQGAASREFKGGTAPV